MFRRMSTAGRNAVARRSEHIIGRELPLGVHPFILGTSQAAGSQSETTPLPSWGHVQFCRLPDDMPTFVWVLARLFLLLSFFSSFLSQLRRPTTAQQDLFLVR